MDPASAAASAAAAALLRPGGEPSLSAVWEDLQPPRKPAHPPALPHGREAVHLRPLRPTLQPRRKPPEAQARAHRGAAVRMPSVRQDVQPIHPPQEAPEDPQLPPPQCGMRGHVIGWKPETGSVWAEGHVIGWEPDITGGDKTHGRMGEFVMLNTDQISHEK